jgi:uncharacterized protein (TIGR03437 family)
MMKVQSVGHAAWWAAAALTFPFLAQTSLAQTAVTLTPSPTALTFTYALGNALPAAQVVSVRASVGTPTYTVTITGANIQWLTVTPLAGSLPANLSVLVNPTSLPVGSYQATLNLTATGVANPLKISVTLVVAAAPPTLQVSATALAFSSPPAQPTTQTLTLTTTGGPIPFTAAPTGTAWLTVSPSTGVVLPGAPVTLTVSADSTPLSPSATPYPGKITIIAAGVPAANKTQTVSVTFLVNALGPAITSIWPASIQTNTPSVAVTIRGTGFYSASVVKIGTQSLPTTVVGTTALVATVPPVLLTAPGVLNFYVANPPPGGNSAPIAFTVTGNPVVQLTANAASQATGGVSPGEIVTMYGEGIGPANPASMQDANADGFVDTLVGGYTVSIDGVASPVLYLSQNQVTVQVPYEVTQGANKTITIDNGTTTATGTVAIAPSAPGIFSMDGSGAGQAAALNFVTATQAYTLNSTTNPAHAGDTIILYLTGEGDYALTVFPRTGLLVPPALTPLPQLNPLPAVTIGGQPATVNFAGPVVGSLLGILQVNAVVPAGSTLGAAVPVSVTIGAAPAQTGITINVK